MEERVAERKQLNAEGRKIKRREKAADIDAATKLFREILRKSPKEFWSIVNNAHVAPDPIPIPIDTQYNFVRQVASLEGIVNLVPIPPNIIEPKIKLATVTGPEKLKARISAAEVKRRILKAPNGKAADKRGIRIETLKMAPDLAYEILADIFNAIMDGAVIESWGETICLLLHKKGLKVDVKNYRTIQIEQTVEKVFSLIWSARLIEWTEENAIPSGTQFGFRPKRSTIDAVFIADAILQRARASRKEKILVFVDFTKAFDTVSRDRLWTKLRKMGIPDKVIDAFSNVYGKVWTQLRGERGETTDFVKFLKGVKQGDPLSTLFFILFINDMTDFLKANGAQGTNIGTAPDLLNLIALFFADDTTLIADTIKDAQRQLDILSAYASLNELEVNVGKTEWTAVGRAIPDDAVLMYREQPLKRSDSFPLLGYCLAASGSRDFHIQTRVVKMNKAYGIWRRILSDHPGLQLKSRINVFSATVNAVGQYGNVMLTDPPSDLKLRGDSDRDKTKRKALKAALGLARHASSATLFALTGQLSLVAQDHIAALRFWIELPKKDPTVRACYEELRAHTDPTKTVGAWVNKGNWAFYIRSLLIYYMGEEEGVETWESGRLWRLDAEWMVKNRFQTWIRESLVENGKLDFWRMMDPGCGTRLGCTNLLDLRIIEHRRDVLRLLTSTHDLNVEEGRHARIPHQDRLCPFGCGTVENELHFLFDCEAYSDRRKHLVNKLKKIGRTWGLESTIWMFMENSSSTTEWDEIRRKRGLQALANYVSKSFKDRGRRLQAIQD